MNSSEYLIVGGGVVGAAIGYGLARQGLKCTLLDAHDRDFRAARGNFGLVWVQSKGIDFPEYARWTRLSAKLWPQLAKELKEVTGIDVQYEKRGGVHYCLDDHALQQRQTLLQQLQAGSDGDFSYRMLDHNELRELEPEVGPTIPGGSWSPHDGHTNPLQLLRALHAGFINQSGTYLGDHRVEQIERDADGYLLTTAKDRFHCRNLILACGLDNARLGPMVGLQQSVFPQRGQILVTERLPRLLNHPSNYLRQTAEGSLQLGDTKEAVGLDDGQDVRAMAAVAERACRIIPRLSQSRIVRGWGALRVLTKDGYPLYEHKDNAWAFSCHSGVTLAAAHALSLSVQLKNQQLEPDLKAFTANRFQE
ncbi:NAD(P)/FAD-dependent oxidoreductase [Marinobacterium lutimaris]|uniref:Glycine/D-amino acid oxidase n=1 Tax=Marinobacterium lutimaris TaxID=568106 RepID=A0A1H5TQG6_9GAMM|nr:FAD-dependent oxidoreductase [Marinobacterium lutimaris]SEF65000.1 Glycine/D-amino acid oxidase [Marinobacterium lutimaris]